MRCQKAMDYVSQEMDEHLPPDVTVDLTRHLDSCPDCRNFRRDLLLGRRAIRATAGGPPDNFEWKLQLKLNQALQQAAGESVFPWGEPEHDKWRWFRNFGAAAAVGMAAVLALAMFLGPADRPGDAGTGLRDSGSPGVAATSTGGAGGSDRLPLLSNRSRRTGLYSPGALQSVSVGGASGAGSGLIDRGWSGRDLEDLRTIQRLRMENNQLNQQLYLQQSIIRGMRAHLDSIGAGTLDLEQE